MSEPVSIRCPRCGRVSYHPEDVRQRYCGACHAFHADMSRRPAWQYLEAENEALKVRVALLSTLATRALAEGWTLPEYERELARLSARGCSVVAGNAMKRRRRERA